MIVLDTNVISELMRPDPDGRVLQWFARQPRAGLFTTTVSEGEVYYGLALLPEGKRREGLHAAARAMFEEDFAGRILPFDTDAARAYGDIASIRRIRGQPISQFDAQIAGIVRSRGASLATRNLRDFVDCGITLVNPWTEM
jgi:predicted nucleic acid-binding protein